MMMTSTTLTRWTARLTTAAASVTLLAACASAQVTDSTQPRPDSAPTPNVAPAIPQVADTTARRPSGPLRLEASLSERKLYMYQGDQLIARYDVAIGKDAHPTPTGQFRIRRIVWNPSWTPPPNAEWARNRTAKGPGERGNPMKMVKIFFRAPDYYIHGTDDLASLGRAASHGCLRMDPEQAAEVARYVMEHGGQPRPDSWFRRILRFRSREEAVNLRAPVTMVIRA